MKEKIKILEKLNIVYKGSNRLPLNNLEIIINFDNEINVYSKELTDLLKEMKSEGLITSSENDWYYSITEKGIKYLEENQTE
jgi:DNA-binding PadR family transcriptional regulator